MYGNELMSVMEKKYLERVENNELFIQTEAFKEYTKKDIAIKEVLKNTDLAQEQQQMIKDLLFYMIDHCNDAMNDAAEIGYYQGYKDGISLIKDIFMCK